MKNLFFALFFMFVSSVTFATNNNLETDQIQTNYELSEYQITSLGICVFSYTLYAYNSETGQMVSESFTQTYPASSQADCRSFAQRFMQVHAGIWGNNF
jgi:hypothetical protein